MRLEAILFFQMILCSCSYRLSQPPARVEVSSGKILENPRIFVPVLDNLSPYSAAEAVLTSALRDKLQETAGLDVVDDKRKANLFLLGRVTRYERKASKGYAAGDQVSQDSGGLEVNKLASSGVVLDIGLEFQLVYPDPELGESRVLWTRSYDESVEYLASDRRTYMEAASAAPFINDARERISLKLLSRAVAQKVLDQVRQDF